MTLKYTKCLPILSLKLFQKYAFFNCCAYKALIINYHAINKKYIYSTKLNAQ